MDLDNFYEDLEDAFHAVADPLVDMVENMIDHGNAADERLTDADWSSLGLTEQNAQDVRDLIVNLPMIGDWAEVLFKKVGWTDSNTPNPSEIDMIREAIREALENTTSQPQMIAYAKQYNVDLNDMMKMRQDLLDVTNSLNLLTRDYSAAQRKLNLIEQHLNDYIQGPQKKAMHSAYHASQSENRKIENDLALKQNQVAQAEQRLQAAQDLTLQPQNAKNDQAVSRVATDLGITVTAETPDTHTKETSSHEKE